MADDEQKQPDLETRILPIEEAVTEGRLAVNLILKLIAQLHAIGKLDDDEIAERVTSLGGTAEGTVAVDLAEVGEQGFDVVHGMGALRMPGKLCLDPGLGNRCGRCGNGLMLCVFCHNVRPVRLYASGRVWRIESN